MKFDVFQKTIFRQNFFIGTQNCPNELKFCKVLRFFLKFIYPEKATQFYEISTLHLSYVVPVKSKVEILQNFVAFSEYMNFIKVCVH